MIDTFVIDSLPEKADQPEFLPLDNGEELNFQFSNATEYFLDRWCLEHEEDIALRSLTENHSYKKVLDRVSQYAQVLVDDFGLTPGNRVLLRGRNSPKAAMLHLAVLRAGGVVVSTIPLLRSGELKKIVKKARVSHCICEVDFIDEIADVQAQLTWFKILGSFSNDNDKSVSFYDVDDLADKKETSFAPFDRGLDWPALIAFTSGTTGEPKGTIHTHGDLLAICETFAKKTLRPNKSDIFCGTPPLAFTYGLGGLLLFPLSVGASALLLESCKPMDLLKAIDQLKPTVCFNSPTAYRMILSNLNAFDISSLRKCVSAGEHLSKATFDAFEKRTGVKLIDGIGSTEMLHLFIASAGDDICPGATGKIVDGYEATILDEFGNELPNGQVGWLAVKGPTGCRYLSDDRQQSYVINGWNVTGDAYKKDDDGYFWYQSRMDDLIISGGHNIAAPEVENALLSHQVISECAVVGVPDKLRGSIVKAYVVLENGNIPSGELEVELQNHVKKLIAPYKYPRSIAFVEELPKTLTGKLKRYELRDREAA